jgi:hypothetical protein
MKSIHETNALNTPVKQYKPIAKSPESKGEQASAPNYRKLSQTPSRATSEEISGRVQFGQPPTDERRQTPNTVPPRVSNRPALSRAKGTKEPIVPHHSPLKPSKPRQPTSSNAQPVSSTDTQDSKFRNRFDHPLTERELNQLRLAKLQGTNQKHIQGLIQQLSGQSKQLAQQLSSLMGSPRQPIKSEVSTVKSEPMAPVKREPREDLTNQLLDAQEDYRILEEDYPKMKPEEQQAALTQLREKYTAVKTANSKHVKKIIQNRLTQIREEIQYL